VSNHFKTLVQFLINLFRFRSIGCTPLHATAHRPAVAVRVGIPAFRYAALVTQICDGNSTFFDRLNLYRSAGRPPEFDRRTDGSDAQRIMTVNWAVNPPQWRPSRCRHTILAPPPRRRPPAPAGSSSRRPRQVATTGNGMDACGGGAVAVTTIGDGSDDGVGRALVVRGRRLCARAPG